MVKINTQTARDELYRAVKDEPLWTVQDYGMRVLFIINHPRAVKFAEEMLLSNPEKIIRINAISLLGEYNKKESIPTLKKALKTDEDLRVRGGCYALLHKLGVNVKVNKEYRLIEDLD